MHVCLWRRVFCLSWIVNPFLWSKKYLNNLSMKQIAVKKFATRQYLYWGDSWVIKGSWQSREYKLEDFKTFVPFRWPKFSFSANSTVWGRQNDAKGAGLTFELSRKRLCSSGGEGGVGEFIIGVLTKQLLPCVVAPKCRLQNFDVFGIDRFAPLTRRRATTNRRTGWRGAVLSALDEVLSVIVAS